MRGVSPASTSRRLFHILSYRRQVIDQSSSNGRYTTFPASLLRFNVGTGSALYDFKKPGPLKNRHIEDGVTISPDGLVRQAISSRPPYSNGAMFMPNTFLMQELIRGFSEECMENDETCKSGTEALIFKVPKGTAVPKTLTLLHEHSARFSVQPTIGMPLQELNNTLNEWYAKYAEMQPIEQWLEENDYADAYDDDDVEGWMSA